MGPLCLIKTSSARVGPVRVAAALRLDTEGRLCHEAEGNVLEDERTGKKRRVRLGTVSKYRRTTLTERLIPSIKAECRLRIAALMRVLLGSEHLRRWPLIYSAPQLNTLVGVTSTMTASDSCKGASVEYWGYFL